MKKKTILKMAGMVVLASAVQGNIQAKDLGQTSINVDVDGINLDSQLETLKETTRINKQKITRTSISDVYNELISMRPSERKVVAQLIREDFTAFMTQNFELSEFRVNCLNTLWKRDLERKMTINDIAFAIENGMRLNGIFSEEGELLPQGKTKKVKAGYKDAYVEFTFD